MNRYFNFPLIFLVYLTVLLYFCIWRFSWIVLSVFIISCILAYSNHYRAMFPLLLIIGSFCWIVKINENYQMSHGPAEIHRLTPITDTIEVNGNALSFRGKSDGQIYQVYYTIHSQSEQKFFKTLSQDIIIECNSSLELPEGQRNFNGFNYKKYLATQNIYHIIKIDEILKIAPQNHLIDLHLLRRKAILFCQQRFPKPMSGYLTGLLFGYLGKDFDQMRDIYTSLGIIHLFALSGMQVNFFIDWLRKILLRLGIRRDIVDKIQIPFSIIYAFLTGLAVSVLRALLQKNIKLQGTDNLAVSFFILLLIMPKFLLTTGGQLTLLYAFLLAMFSFKFPLLKGIKKVLFESGLLSIGVLPLLVLDFHIFQPLSILLTFVFSIIFDLLMLPVLMIIFVISLLSGISININRAFIDLENIIAVIDRYFHYPLVFGTPTLFIFLILLIVCGLFIDFIHHRKRAILLFLFAILLFFFSKNPIRPSITMVDIGQGDSFLLQDRLNKQTILIDTGGRVEFGNHEKWQQMHKNSNASKTLIPYLQSRGIDKINTLILTHTDDDHVGDLLSLADKIKIQHVWVSQGSLTNSIFVKKLRATKLKIHVVKTGDAFSIFDGKLRVLSSGYDERGNNNDSIVTYGKFYGKSFLFTGDLEREGEAELLKNYPNLKVDVLKVGHHGSKTSSSPKFISAIHPQIALISAGLNNRYKHPNQETLNTFNNAHIKVYRTDQQGAVRFVESFGHWEIQTVK